MIKTKEQKIILEQQGIADYLLAEFKKADPLVILAGGAVRDWYFNKPARDLDFYIRLPNHNTQSLVEKFLTSLDIENADLMQRRCREEVQENYQKLPGLIGVYEGSCGGWEGDIKVNVMIMKQNRHGGDIVKDFDCDICKCYYKGAFTETVYFPEFLKAVDTKIINLNPKYRGNELHIQKMKERFPEYTFVSHFVEEQKERGNFYDSCFGW